MACQITFREREVQLNNHQFSNLLAFTIFVAESSLSDNQVAFVDHMKKMESTEFWPGCGIEIETDFPNLDEQKFWCRMFFDTARAITTGIVGNTEHKYWQAQTTHQAYSTALLFEYAVRTVEFDWRADTLGRTEFDRVVNGIAQ